MADNINIDKVVVTKVRSKDPAVKITVKTTGANYSSEDNLGASVFILNSKDEFIHAQVIGATSSGNDLWDIEVTFLDKLWESETQGDMLGGYVTVAVHNLNPVGTQNEASINAVMYSIEIYPADSYSDPENNKNSVSRIAGN